MSVCDRKSDKAAVSSSTSAAAERESGRRRRRRKWKISIMGFRECTRETSVTEVVFLKVKSKKSVCIFFFYIIIKLIN